MTASKAACKLHELQFIVMVLHIEVSLQTVVVPAIKRLMVRQTVYVPFEL
jgi:hypothetical protein